MYYVLDEKGNRKEGLTKEETLAILQQAINNGSLAGIEKDSAFVSKLKCCVGGETYQMAFITQAKYNELFTKNQLTANTFYYITDDPTEENIEANIEAIAKELDATNEIIGDIVAGKTEVVVKKKLIWSGELNLGDVINIELKENRSYLFVTKTSGDFYYDYRKNGSIVDSSNPTKITFLQNHSIDVVLAPTPSFTIREAQIIYCLTPDGQSYGNGLPNSLCFTTMKYAMIDFNSDGTLTAQTQLSTGLKITEIYEIME